MLKKRNNVMREAIADHKVLRPMLCDDMFTTEEQNYLNQIWNDLILSRLWHILPEDIQPCNYLESQAFKVAWGYDWFDVYD